MNEVLTNAAAFLGALGGYEALKFGVNTWLYRGSYKKKEEAEAGKAELDNLNDFAAEWKSLYERSEAKLLEKELKNEALLLEKSDYLSQLMKAGLENQRLLFFRCDRLDCGTRAVSELPEKP
jgi:hypothetical protein